MLDQMSSGRLEMGFGRGASPIEIGLYGQSPAQSQGIYGEGVELILRGLAKPFAPGGWQPALPVDTGPSLAYWFTLAKFLLIALCLTAIIRAVWEERR